jgi:hypothetical protein
MTYPDDDDGSSPPSVDEEAPVLARRKSAEMVRMLIHSRVDSIRPQSFIDVIDELSTLEKALRHIRSVLIARSSSIREAFRRLDRESYGYIEMDDFRHALEAAELSLDEKNTVCAFADLDGSGKIDYAAFFNLLFRDHYQAKRDLIAQSTLRQTVVVFRHGARFPLKPFPLAASWPHDAIFWKTYGGKLTPTGQAQCHQLGQLLRQKYLQEEHLLGEDDPNLPEELYVYTSNSDRTLLSAQSVLLGMFPNVAQSFAIEKAQDASVDSATDLFDDEDGDIDDEHQTIKIHLADMSMPYLPLLHGHKNNPKYASLKAEEFRRAALFREMSADPDYIALLDKLYKVKNTHPLFPILIFLF